MVQIPAMRLFYIEQYKACATDTNGVQMSLNEHQLYLFVQVRQVTSLTLLQEKETPGSLSHGNHLANWGYRPSLATKFLLKQ